MAKKLSSRRAGALALALALFLAPLAIGSVHIHVVAILAALAMLAAATTCIGRERRVNLSPITMAMGLATLTALAQVIPLPTALVSLISPAHGAHIDAARELATGALGSWSTLSADSVATWDRIARWATLTLMVWSATHLGEDRAARKTIHHAILASGGVMLVAGLAQRLVDKELILGFYAGSVPASIGSTFVNWNHAASLYALCMLLAFFIASDSERARAVRIVMGMAGALFLCATFLNQSISASALAILGLLVWAADALLRWRQVQLVAVIKRRALAWASALAFVVSMIGIWMIAPRFMDGEGINDSIRGRVTLAQAAMDGSADYWLLGSGAGALERVIYPHVDWSQTEEARIVVVESEIFGWMIELGWPATLAICVLLLIAASGPLLCAARHHRWKAVHTHAIMVSVLAIVLLQLHFPLYALGLGAPLLVAWELWRKQVLQNRGRTDTERRAELLVMRASSLKLSPSRGKVIVIALSLTSIIALASAIRSHGDHDEARFASRSDAQLEALLGAIPSEGRLYATLAQRAMVAKEHDRALALIKRAHALEPMPRMRALLATILARQGKTDEARAHYEAVLFGEYREKPGQFIPIVLDGTIDAEERARIFAQGSPELWRSVMLAIRKKEGDVAASDFALGLIDALPGRVAPYAFLLRTYDLMGRQELVNIWARQLLMASVDDAVKGREEAVWYMARAQARRKQRAEALALLDQAITQMPDGQNRRLERLMMSIYTEDDVLALGDAAIDTLAARRARACSGEQDGATRTHCAMIRALIHEKRDEEDEAERAFRLIYDRAPKSHALAKFYLRNRKCIQLRTLLNDDREEVDMARIKKFVESCYDE